MAPYSFCIAECCLSFEVWVFFPLHDIFRVYNVESVGCEHVLLRLYQVNPTFKSPANIDFLTLIADIDQLWPLVDGIYSVWAMLTAVAIYSLGFLGCSVERLCTAADPVSLQPQSNSRITSLRVYGTEITQRPGEAGWGQGRMETCAISFNLWTGDS